MLFQPLAEDISCGSFQEFRQRDLKLLEPEIERVDDAFVVTESSFIVLGISRTRACVESVFETTKRSSDFRSV